MLIYINRWFVKVNGNQLQTGFGQKNYCQKLKATAILA